MKNCFKISNEVLRASLSPSEVMVYACLVKHKNIFGSVIMKFATIGSKCGLTVGTVKTAVEKLSTKGLLCPYRRRNYEGNYIANGYHITIPKGSFTYISNALFSMKEKLSKGAFVLYLYLKMCAGNRNYAFPSLRNICQGIGMSISTIVRKMEELSLSNLVKKNHYIKLDGSFGHNQYRLNEEALGEEIGKEVITMEEIIEVKEIPQEKRVKMGIKKDDALCSYARTYEGHQSKNLYNYSVIKTVEKIKRFLKNIEKSVLRTIQRLF